MFTEKELNESIEELTKLEAEIQKLDALYDAAKSQLPGNGADSLSPQDSSVVDELMAEAKHRAEKEGRARSAAYRDAHVSLEEPRQSVRPGRRGLIV